MEMINVIASIQVKAGHRDDFIAAFKANVPAVLAEEGCVEYRPAIDLESGIDAQLKDETVVTVIEKWDTLDALKAHLEAPHMLAFRETAGDWVDEVSLKILEDA